MELITLVKQLAPNGSTKHYTESTECSTTLEMLMVQYLLLELKAGSIPSDGHRASHGLPGCMPTKLLVTSLTTLTTSLSP